MKKTLFSAVNPFYRCVGYDGLMGFLCCSAMAETCYEGDKQPLSEAMNCHLISFGSAQHIKCIYCSCFLKCIIQVEKENETEKSVVGKLCSTSTRLGL